uniref:Uncharacterized protein n=1 Tax=Rhizophora mucronata TaxID=61149 RepID=A0A2P2M0S7_RHIMU
MFGFSFQLTAAQALPRYRRGYRTSAVKWIQKIVHHLLESYHVPCLATLIPL